MREGARCRLFQRVRDCWRGPGTNWGNLLGGAAWRTSNMADFRAASQESQERFSAMTGMTDFRLLLNTYGPVSSV
jgi:hypothetical protein